MSRIKEIWCIHHSHLDVGYTHPQDMLLALQCDYIEQAIELCVKTENYPEESQFRWTCEAYYPVVKWMETAEPEKLEQFKRLVNEGKISVAALPMHTTPGATSLQMYKMLEGLEELRAKTGAPIKTAINHDVNGQPWTLGSFLIDSQVEFYMTGINIHMGGVPFSRPYVFNWEMPDGRKLPTFVGEHYSLFSQFFFTYENSTARMHEGIKEYVERIEQQGIWNEDFLLLTATNPPLFDNNSPDANLADLICRYNEEGHEFVVRFVTPEMVYKKIAEKGIDTLPTHKGDWTDYWNFGSASTARETKINRKAKRLLGSFDFLTSINGKLSNRYKKIREDAYENSILFDEHTWGASDSVNKPHQEETYAQLNVKKGYAYHAANYAAYLLGKATEKIAGNPQQSDTTDGIFLINPTGVTINQEIILPPCVPCENGRTLDALRVKAMLPYNRTSTIDESVAQDFWVDKSYGCIEIPPFTEMRIPFSEIEAVNKENLIIKEEGKIKTPYYEVSFSENNGRIKQIKSLKTGRNMLDESSEFGLFDLVVQRVDARFAKENRKAIFPRDVDLGNKSISQWEREWKSTISSLTTMKNWSIEEKEQGITIAYTAEAEGVKDYELKISFSAVHNRIGIDISFMKEEVHQPEGVYFTLPLALNSGWECVYDTADTFVKLDDEQLGKCCRDWITVDKTVSVFDENGGVSLACPDAPMVQIGGFNFGRELSEIEREKNPVVLAWPLNNFWDTNFAATQGGMQVFHYELADFAKFSEKETDEFAINAERPCIIGAAINCENKQERQLLSLKSNGSARVLFAVPNAEGEVTVAIKNYEKTAINAQLICVKNIADAEVVDVVGNVKTKLEVKNNQTEININARAIAFIRLKL